MLNSNSGALRVAISGSHGLLGTQLIEALKGLDQQVTVIRLVHKGSAFSDESASTSRSAAPTDAQAPPAGASTDPPPTASGSGSSAASSASSNSRTLRFEKDWTYDIKSGTTDDPKVLESLDVVYHLAGEDVLKRKAEVPADAQSGSSVASTGGGGLVASLLGGWVDRLAGGFAAWTLDKQRDILDSRVESTKLLVQTLKTLVSPPRVFVCASCVTYFGYAPSDVINSDESPAGSSFLAKVCVMQQKEAMALASNSDIRVVIWRGGHVVSARGGLFAALLPVFQARSGGNLGDGSQWWSWISLRDAVKSLLFVSLESKGSHLEGAVNACSPNPITNATMVLKAHEVLHPDARVTLSLPIPAALLRNLFREMADECLLGGQRVAPKKLLSAGFVFLDEGFESAIAFCCREQEVLRLETGAQSGLSAFLPKAAVDFAESSKELLQKGLYAAEEIAPAVQSVTSLGHSLVSEISTQGQNFAQMGKDIFQGVSQTGHDIAGRIVETGHDIAQKGSEVVQAGRDAATDIAGEVRQKGHEVAHRALSHAQSLVSGASASPSDVAGCPKSAAPGGAEVPLNSATGSAPSPSTSTSLQGIAQDLVNQGQNIFWKIGSVFSLGSAGSGPLSAADGQQQGDQAPPQPRHPQSSEGDPSLPTTPPPSLMSSGSSSNSATGMAGGRG